ncbi:3-hydroxyacyl-CoA dehydrogenase family protein [Streptomyces sp. NPDC002490]|uniref:3-hydroxyacyl-CoA dehydrogenase family protein n=1 Tax=Streptomyces sp. NPDC002490 TaxID=3154416 RepID=UPI00332A9DB5
MPLHEMAGQRHNQAMDSMYAEFKEPLYAAPPLLQRMVDAGRLGRKSGSGFYPYG